MAKYSPQDVTNKQFFSVKLNELMDVRNKKQIDLHNDLGIPKSTLTGYVKGTSLPTVSNLRKLAAYFDVSESELDLRFRSASRDSQFSPKDERDIQTKLQDLVLDLSASGALAFSKQSNSELSDESRELLLASLENSLRIAKQMAKKKYTPKKYRE